MNYPKRIIQKGEADKQLVKAIQKKLNERGCGPVAVDGDFGSKTANAVKLFQARFADRHGNPLQIDGKVGSLTWSSLFGTLIIPADAIAPNLLLTKTLEIARTQIGTLENPAGSNWGPQVAKYLNSVGINFPAAWCMAFVYWCFNESSSQLNRNNPLVKTGGVLKSWNKATCKKITTDEASANPSLVKPGHIFIMSYNGGLGHTGFVEKVEGGLLTTIEGNTNDGGSREGIGVFQRKARRINSVNKGFLFYE